MKETKDILKRAMKHGFDLSFIENYNEKRILQGLYDYLVRNHYYCSMEDGVIYVGIDIVQDIAEVTISNKTMKVKPITDKGFFDILISLFKYIRFASSIEQKQIAEEDISTETDEDDDESSEEMWL